MPLTLAQKITLLGDLLSADLKNYEGNAPSNAEATVQLNWSSRLIGLYTHVFDPVVTLTLDEVLKHDIRDVTAPAVVTRKMVRVYKVVVNGNPLYEADGREIGLWS